MAYFAGDLDGSGAHPREAEAIAEHGRQFVDEHVRALALSTHLTPGSGASRTCSGPSIEKRRSDGGSYMFRLSLEYARALLRPDSDDAAMDYVRAQL